MTDTPNLRAFLELRPYGHTGANGEIALFTHCGITHPEGAECVVCAALAATPPAEPGAGLDVDDWDSIALALAEFPTWFPETTARVTAIRARRSPSATPREAEE